jgi:hypothetical protein
VSLHTQRTSSTAIAPFPIPGEDPHAFGKCIAVNNSIYSVVIKIGEKLQGAQKSEFYHLRKTGPAFIFLSRAHHKLTLIPTYTASEIFKFSTCAYLGFLY